jgi:molybdopterin-containing oxidoreductase family membrane subunit
MVIIDMGRPDRLLNIVIFGRWQSPILWDFLAITTYMTGSLIYLYLPLIPDMALCRDRLSPGASPLKRTRFRVLSLGWVGTPDQRRKLAVALGMMMVLVIPVAVMMHTVTSWLFSMTLREPWDSPMFGIYFVGGAIYSGIGIILILLAIIAVAGFIQLWILFSPPA